MDDDRSHLMSLADDPRSWLSIPGRPEWRRSAPEITLALVGLLDEHFAGRLDAGRFADAILDAMEESEARYVAAGFLKRQWIDLGLEDDLRKAIRRYEIRLVEWENERTARSEWDAAALALRGLASHMRDRFSRVASEWDRSESDFRKPALGLYKHFLERAKEPLPTHLAAWIDELDGRIRTDVIDDLVERRNVFLEQRGIQEWMTDIGLVAEALPSSIRAITRFMADGPPKRDNFDLREVVGSLIGHGLFRRIRPVSETMNRQFEALVAQSMELRDMVAVNLQAGQEADPADREALVHGGLERAAQRLQELMENYRVRLARVTDQAALDIDRYAKLLETAAESGDFDEIVTLNRELRVRQQAASWRLRIIAGWSRFIDEAGLRYRHASERISEFVRPARVFLGHTDASDTPAARTRASDYVAETDRRLAELPLIYRTLFRFAPVRDPRYLKGRDPLLDRVRESYGRWQAGTYSNVVLVGEPGSGKTSVIDELLRTTFTETEPRRIRIPHTLWTDQDLLEVLKAGFDLPQVRDLEELAEAIGRMPSQIILMEGLQNLYLRQMNGFKAMERIQLLLAQTGNRHFWFLTCTRYGWNYLDDVIQISGSFTHVLETDRLDMEDIRSAIMTRHRVSGYRAVFTPSESVKRSRSYKKLVDDDEARQQFLEAAYFKDLAGWADGNITIAMLFWLRSIRDADSDTFTILPFSEDLIEVGDTFQLDDLFALAAILQHDDLRVEELALNQNRSIPDSRMTFTRLHARRILNESDGRYTLNPVLLRPVTVLLQSRNILH